MTSSRQNKNRNSRRTPTATSNKRNFTGSMLLATPVNTASTASATPVQQASHVDQISDLPTLPNKNASLEEQLKQQQLLIDKLTSRISALESQVQLLERKIVIQETVSNLLQQKANNLETYSRRPCAILSGIQKSKKESRENIKTSVFQNLQKTGLPLEEIENIDKLHGVGRFDHETQTQPITVKFKIHSFEEKSTTSKKSLQKQLKFPHH